MDDPASITLAGHVFKQRDLLRRVVLNLKCPRGTRNRMRWVLVMTTFGVGSTVANALCREFNLDPDEIIK